MKRGHHDANAPKMKYQKRQLHDLVMDEKNTISIDEALAKAKKRYKEHRK